jgi:UDP-4-amino-4,6-dideoxy-N-acetyl-beta-L-altrosamine transaminase
MINYSKQSINNSDIKAVSKTLKSNFLTQGPKTVEFETKIKKFTGAKYSVVVNSASSALLMSCLSLDLKKNDLIWTTPNTFAASANCIVLSGQKVDFVDIDDRNWNLSIEKLEIKLKKAKIKKKLPKAIIVVHLAGLPVDPIELKKLSKKYKFYIIEDASHSIGSKYYGKKVGCCKWSDLCVFSFHPVKIITTGEGGCVTTNTKKFYDKMMLVKNNGITKNSKNFNNYNLGPWYYEQQTMGYNFRMNDIMAALGISQLKRINLMLQKRNKIATIYKKELKNLPIEFQEIDKNFYSSYHLFIIKLTKNNKNIHRKLFIFLRKNKIFVNLHYLPVHLHPFYRKMGFKKGNFPASENYSESAISIPIFPDLKLQNQKKVINLLKKFFK